MPRRPRSYAPGCVFHITGRTSNKEHWLEAPDLRNDTVSILGECVARTDAELIAWAVMTNHVHLLVRQGDRPLAALAQPFFRRVALRVQLRFDREGHIFKGSFFDKLCKDVEHLRSVIDYIHYNPVDSRMCKTTDEYAWSSCPIYTGASCAHLAPKQPKLHPALEIFATRPKRTPVQLQADYRKFASWTAVCRELPEGAELPRAPLMRAGEDLWKERFGTGYKSIPVKRIDLRDIVRNAIRDIAPGLTLDLLLSRRGGRAITAVRAEAVRRAILNGHRGATIARYLNISESSVSMIGTKLFGRAELRSEVQGHSSISGSAKLEALN